MPPKFETTTIVVVGENRHLIAHKQNNRGKARSGKSSTLGKHLCESEPAAPTNEQHKSTLQNNRYGVDLLLRCWIEFDIALKLGRKLKIIYFFLCYLANT